MMNENQHIPSGYKPTPLGPIPENWEVKRLGDCFDICAGRDLIKETYSPKQTVKHQYPIFSNSLENKGLYGYTSTPRHKANSITITGRGSLGHAEYREQDFDAIIRLLVLTPKIEISCELITNYINFSQPFIYESTGVPQLTAPQIQNTKLLLPPYEEQLRIMDVLHNWDTAIEKQTALIEKLTLRKRGLMQQLLTGKKRLKGFEGEWKKCTYSNILSEVKRTLIWDENELYKLISVRRRSEGLFFRESLYGREIATKNLRPAKTGDFLISKMQIVHGASGLVTEEFDDAKISGSYISLVSKNSDVLDIKYFNLWSQTPIFYHQTFVSSFGVHIEKMTFDFDTFMSFSMPLPPIKEQHAIVSLMDSINKEIELANKKLARLQEEKKGLMQVLLTGKKRIK